MTVPALIEQRVEEGQRLRGWIANGYAQIEYFLGDIIVRSLQMPEYDAYAIPLGNFEPGHGFVPDYSVYEDRMEPWVSITGEAIEHYD